ncbi:ubiquinol oxidase subunit II [Sphingomonas sanguinis]|uniref:ubiquinol oxidase subunit II n=1 Tax=Sphingomonas sp. LC-1 TaxID=3110957 RepID=UPI0021BBA9A5|nr:ubiquinol oxidase subunit II [Sphingomonas sp. LC-1]MCT8001615.1 ubiquinol oxidase subunit II [Sphingomonas sp. LC-1]
MPCEPRLAHFPARFACVALCTLLSACEPGILNPAGPIAAGERSIFFNALAVMLAIVVPVIVLAFVFGWWFRASNTRAKHLPEWAYSGRLELLVWSVPALAIMFLGGIAWIGSHDLDPPKPIASKAKAMTVEVVATDWKWLFLYPEQGIATINRLVVPVGTPVKFRITSAGVMNSFFVPQLGSQIYAMSGMDSTLHLRADKAGRYRGLSAHYSGEGFADMDFFVDAVPQGDFDRFVATAKAGKGKTLDWPEFVAMAHPSRNVRPASYPRLQPGLYDQIVMRNGAPEGEQAKDGREQ